MATGNIGAMTDKPAHYRRGFSSMVYVNFGAPHKNNNN